MKNVRLIDDQWTKIRDFLKQDPNIVAIIQARMNSTRLPGKVLLLIKGEPVLHYVISRTRNAHKVTKVVVATSINTSDDPIAVFCKKRKIHCFRGSLDNVLSRYFHCAKQYRADIVIRITGDCPLIDADIIDTAVETLTNTQADYVSNTLRRTFPRGLDVEIMTFDVLAKAYMHAQTESEKEHVTPYVYHTHPELFRIEHVTANTDNSMYRITVDTRSDLAVVTKLIEDYQADTKHADEIIAILKQHPELVAINRDVPQKTI